MSLYSHSFRSCLSQEDVRLRYANLTYDYCCFSQKSKMDNEPELKTAEESFRQGWQEALQGEPGW